MECAYPQALSHAKKALFLDPNSYKINDVMGLVYFAMKKYDKAQAYFSKSIQEEKEYTQARVNLAQTLIEKKSLNPALAHLKKAETDLTYTEPSKVYSRIGQVLYYQKKYSSAVKYLESSVKMDANNCLGPLYLGRIHYNRKQYKQAVQQFQKVQNCLKEVKTFSCVKKPIDHIYYRALSEMKLKRTQSALKFLKSFIKKTDKSHIYYSSARKLLEAFQKQ